MACVFNVAETERAQPLRRRLAEWAMPTATQCFLRRTLDCGLLDNGLRSHGCSLTNHNRMPAPAAMLYAFAHLEVRCNKDFGHIAS